MKRIWGHVVAGLGFAGIAGSVIPACAHNDQSVFIRVVMAPPSQAQGAGACVFQPDPTLPHLATGVLDIAFLTNYSGVLLVGNQLVPQGAVDQVRTESSRVVLKGAIIRVTDSAQNEKKSYTRLTSGFIDPAVGAIPTYGAASVELLDTESVQIATCTVPGVTPTAANCPLGPLPRRSNQTRRLISHVKVFGNTLGGQSVESNEYDFPIDICNGCLVTFPTGSEDAAKRLATGVPNCAAGFGGGGGTSTQVVQPCVVGQDQQVDCRLCVSSNTICDPGAP